MANASSFAGLFNLPAQSITGATETALLVPAQGLFPGFPSPTLAAGVGFAVQAPSDVNGSLTFDGHAFVVRVAGKLFTGAASTFICNLYQVPATILAAGTQATLGNDNVLVTNAASGAITGSANFILEAEFIWDSVAQKLNGLVTKSQVNGANVAPNGGSAGTNVVTTQRTVASIANLNFLPSFTFGTGNAANTVMVTEFLFDRA